jgi:hypothetical protein
MRNIQRKNESFLLAQAQSFVPCNKRRTRQVGKKEKKRVGRKH